MNTSAKQREKILIRGARQNNLKNIDIDLPTHELIVVTGVSGSGKSTLVFDTIYAEGQRRYMETFSAYARQFLDRMDKPSVEHIDGIPPAIAIGQSNPVRTSRSTVGTMTELNDYIKLLFARLSDLYCHQCDQLVTRDSTQSIIETIYKRVPHGQRCMVCLPIEVPENFTDEEVIRLLDQQGYTKIHQQVENQLEVVQDRLVINEKNRSRLFEAVEAALFRGKGQVIIYPLNEHKEAGTPQRFSTKHQCAACDIDYADPSPSLFSFNSPVGACESCKGFGRLIGVDYGLVIPDERKTLAEGAIKPFQTASNKDIQKELIKQAKKNKVPIDVSWKDLAHKHQRWVIEGEGRWSDGVWFGIGGFFRWLERKSYKMHVRVLLSKYRSYSRCPACEGARLKPEALWWRLNRKALGKNQKQESLNLHQVMQLPLNECLAFFEQLDVAEHLDEPAELILTEIRTRLKYLIEVGLEYLTLDRQTRTLSGGEAQRINLTAALGTSLVNTLFVLDEPSIGLHARDVNRLIGILRRLRDAGNTLIVVEHDAQIMLAADRVIDMGPGPGRLGGNIQFYGTPKALLRSRRSLTADYLSGRKQIEFESKGAAINHTHRRIRLEGVTAHNLNNVSVDIPLQGLVCITGVSGSGKSTLMRGVLYPALCKLKGKPVEQPGSYQQISGHEQVGDVVLVDQSPIGKTTRSTPCTYVGAFDAIS